MHRWEQACTHVLGVVLDRLALYQLRDALTVLLLAACFLLNCVGPLLCVESSWASEYGLLPSDEQGQGLVLNATYLLQVRARHNGLMRL